MKPVLVVTLNDIMAGVFFAAFLVVIGLGHLVDRWGRRRATGRRDR